MSEDEREQVEGGKLIRAVLIGAGGCAFLLAFYSVVKASWPSSYFSGSSLPEYVVSRRLTRFLTFRCLPVFAVCTLCFVTTDRLGSWAWLAALTAGGGHTALTSGRALVEVLTGGRSPRLPDRSRFGAVLIEVLPGIVVLSLSTGTAIALGDALDDLVPQPGSLVEAAWTGLFVAVAAGLLKNFTSGAPKTSSLLDAARSAVTSSIESEVRTAAVARGLEVEVLQAVLYSEVLQRPLWWRRGEAAFGRLMPQGGTFGIAQTNPRPGLTDGDSVCALADEIAIAFLVRSGGAVSPRLVQAAAYLHCGDEVYAKLAADLYVQMQRRWYSSSDELADDRLPVVRVLPSRMRGQVVRMAGEAAALVDYVLIRTPDSDNQIGSEIGRASRTEDQRWQWSIDIPIADSQGTVEVQAVSGGSECQALLNVWP